ncbi:MAG: hypothetical protein AAGB48_01885 [Planctomycetota bacterium]
MADTTRLGEARVEVTANTEQLQTKLRTAEGQVNQFANAADDSSKRVRRSFGQISEELQGTLSRQAGVVTGFIGIGAAIAAIGVGAFNTGKRIREAFAGTEAKRFAEEVKAVGTSLRSLQNEIQSIGLPEDRLRDLRQSIVRSTLEDTSAVSNDLQDIQNSRSLTEQVLAAGLETAKQGFRSLSSLLDGSDTDFSRFVETLSDGPKKIGDAFRGDLIPQVETTNERINELGRNAEIAQAQATQAVLRLTRQAADAELEAARAITQPASDLDKALSDLEDRADSLRDLAKGLGDAGQDAIRPAIDELELAALTLRRDADSQAREDARQQIQESRDALRAEVEDLRRAELDPIAREIEDLRDRQEELRDQRGELADQASVDLIGQLLGLIDSKISELQRQQQDQFQKQERQLEESVRRGMEAALNNSTSILSIIGNVRTAAAGINSLRIGL